MAAMVIHGCIWFEQKIVVRDFGEGGGVNNFFWYFLYLDDNAKLDSKIEYTVFLPDYLSF